MKKWIAIFLSALLLFCLVGCNGAGDLVLDEVKTYEITEEIQALDIRIGAVDVNILQGEKFCVESNLKKLEVRERDGCLSVKDLSRRNGFGFGDYSLKDAVLTIILPKNASFERIYFFAGAGKLAIDALSAETVDLELGAGNVTIGALTATREIDIEGGAGRIEILDGALHDLDLEMGVGELKLSAALLGDCDLALGVGSSEITLIGSMADYTLDIEKGLGAITVDGKTVTDFGSSGSGASHVEISGGVGAICVNFKEVE